MISRIAFRRLHLPDLGCQACKSGPCPVQQFQEIMTESASASSALPRQVAAEAQDGY
jgi:hypothetical protein